MPFSKSKRISNFKEKLEQNRKKKYRYEYSIRPSERNFIRNNFGRDLLKLTKPNVDGLSLPSGIYSIYDPLEKQEYFYFDPIQIGHRNIRFVIDFYDEIKSLINLKKDKIPKISITSKLFHIARGVDGALTFIQCDNDEFEFENPLELKG